MNNQKLIINNFENLSENYCTHRNRFEIEPVIKNSNNFNHLEDLKWFEMSVNANIPKKTSMFNFGGPTIKEKLMVKIGIGRIPYGRENQGELHLIIPNHYIDMLAKYNVIPKDINHLNQLR